MPESGGPTTQSGILYQNSIAALFLGRLCDATSRPEFESVTHVRVETLDSVDDIVVTFADNHKAFIQAKEDIRASDSAWKKLWEDFGKQYQSAQFAKGADRIAFWVGNYRDDHTSLRELCQRAISSSIYQEWQSRITEEQRGVLGKIKPHLPPELLDNSTLLHLFKHIEVEIHPFPTIERDEAPRWMPITSIYSITLFRLLRDQVGGASRIRGEFTSYQLQKLLVSENPDLVFSVPMDIEEIKGSIRACSSLLRQQKNTIGNMGIHIRRNIVDEIVNWIINSSNDIKNLAMLIDQAGTGKTVALQDVLIDLEARGYDVLAIKADQQLSGINLLSDIPNRLELSQSPENILSRLARLGRVAVLIDQIDALSLSLAHDQATLDIVLDFIARLRRIPNLRIVISCRLFDRNSDQRLRQIHPIQQFSLTQFTEDEISGILSSMEVSYQDLLPSTRNLLQTPLHLNLFALALENAADSRSKLLGVTSLQELYGAIWENVVLSEDTRAPSKVDRVEVLRLIKNYMSQNQCISVPKSALLQPGLAYLEQAMRWLASAGILISGKSGWTFIHQTFFDYLYAREFVEQGENLVETILHSDQGLFLRPQLIQVIEYMRGTNEQQYLKDLTRLLLGSGLRYHLYDLLLRWFGSISNPTDAEWLIARRMLVSEERCSLLVRRMFGNPEWFERLRKTLIPTWLSKEVDVEGLVIPYLISLADKEATQLSAIDLLRPFIGKNETWNKRLFQFVFGIQDWYSIEAAEFYEQVIFQTKRIRST